MGGCAQGSGEIKLIKQQYSNWQVRMKVQIKSVLKANFETVKWLDEGQIMHQIGNNIHVLQVAKSESEFINLNKQNRHLYDFVASPNSRYIFTAEQIANGVEICAYTLAHEKKTIRLSDISNYVPVDSIETIDLLTDQFESSVVYVLTRAKHQTCCFTLIDMLRTRVISHGFLTDFNDANVCSEETYQISICGRNFVRRMKAVDGAWVVQEKLPKKLLNSQIIYHKWLPLARCLMATKTSIYIVEDGDIVQTFNISSEDDPIFSVIKISKGFIIFYEKGKMKLFGEENGEDGLYTQLQQLKLSIQKYKIKQVEFNKKSEEILVAASNGKFYVSKLEEASTAGKQNYFNFEQINLNYSTPLMGSLSTTGGQNYCLISSERNVELWDMSKLCSTITLQVNNLGQDKVIKASALNSDGHSLCIGYSDRVRFYRILLNKFKQFGEYPVKNTSLIHYSHGGQLIAIIFGKGTNSCITILNTLNLKEVMNFKLGYKPAQVIWNEYDDQVYVSGEDTKAISIFQISSKSKKGFLQFEQQLTFIRFDYLTRKIMASSGSEIHLIDSDHKNETIIKPKIQHFDFVFPVEGIYLAADKKGGLYCSTTSDFQKYQYLSLFANQRFNLLYRREMLIAYTSPANVILLKVKLNNESTAQSELHENVVLVEKDQINKFFDKVKLLEGQLDQLQASTAVKVDEERKKYIQNLEQNEKIFRQQINFLQKKLYQTQSEKSRQQKSNAKVFEQLQSGQIKNVNDLEKIYDMKLKLQKQKCLTLEQECLEQKMKYENIIKGLEEKHNNDIDRIRKEYSERLSKEVKNMQVEKERHNQYKKKVETKLIDLQEEGQMALFEVQLNKDGQIMSLTERLSKLSREYDLKIIALHNMEEAMSELSGKYDESKDRIKKNEKIVQENINRVLILERQIEKKNKIIEQKNACIEQQAHQIDGLEKAKYVLSFRTTEVRKQLQPKELLIEKLKNQMFKLDQEYKSEVKKNFDLAQRLQKLEKISLNYKKQNGQIKTQLKNKERTHNDMCSEIFHIVNSMDAKQWNSSLVKIYQNYIKQDKIKIKGQKNDDSTSQEINRHLIHVEQSLHQVATGNEKMLKGKEQEVIRKMKENAELVYDLNIMRKKENEYLNDIKQKTTQISRLKRQLNEMSNNGHKSTRANTANTGMTRRLVSRDTVHQLNNSDWVDLSIKRPSEHLLPDKSKKGRVFSAHKTMVWREENRREKSKISDLARELQSAKNTIMRQDRMIEELNQRLLGIPQEHLT